MTFTGAFVLSSWSLRLSVKFPSENTCLLLALAHDAGQQLQKGFAVKRVLAWVILLIVTGLGNGVQAEEQIRNGDFSTDENVWRRAGKIVYLDAAGAVVEKGTEGAKPVFALDLTPNRWTIAEQVFRNKDKAKSITILVRLKASADFSRNDSADYSDVNFKAGGTYYWSAIVYPKVDFFVRLADATHNYGLIDLKPGGGWQTLKLRLDDLNPAQRERTLFLNAAPGSGTIYIESVSAVSP